MSARFPHLAQRLFNQPVAILPAKAEIVMAAVADRFGVTHLFSGGRPVGLSYDWDEGDRADNTPYQVLAGVAVIPVEGTLVQKLGSLRPYSGMTGYDGIRACFLDALADDGVDAIVLDVDSPGGEVAGCFDLVDLIYQSRGAKPVWAILNECAYSAAYALASAADRVIVPRTGGTGSIGVVCLHADLSQALSKAGIQVTIVRSAERKYEGNQYEPLGEDAAARLQAVVDESALLFCETVARNRDLKLARVQGTKAGTFQGAAGVDAGLAAPRMAPAAALPPRRAQHGGVAPPRPGAATPGATPWPTAPC